MRCSALCIVLLAISEVLFIHAKVLVVVPRHVRRTPATTAWRPSPIYYKKSPYGENDYQRSPYYTRSKYYRKPLSYNKPSSYQYGADEFDQAYDVNQAQISQHGKSISPGIPFGKGYLPYDNIKSSSLPFVHERYAGGYPRQPVIPDYPNGITSVGQEYSGSALTHSYESPQIDSLFSDVQSAIKGELQDNQKDNNNNKYYIARSIEKDFTLRNQQALSDERDTTNLAKGIDVSKDATSTAYNHAGVQGTVVLPAGIPPTTIAGNKNGIVLRDSVALDDYHKKLEELAKNWPSVLHGGEVPDFSTHRQLQTGNRFSTVGLPDSAFDTGTGWLPGYSQSKKSYSVREDQIEPSSHDFRTVPVRGASFHAVPLGVNVGVSALAPRVHG